MGEVRHARVGEERIDIAAIERAVADVSAGAVVVFSGDVRDHDRGRSVASLTYEGHPTAERIVGEVAREVAAMPGVIALAVEHRIGPIPIGESALVAAVSAAHRGEAFDACRALVDLVKDRLPVWKHQVFADGTDEWVNCA